MNRSPMAYTRSLVIGVALAASAWGLAAPPEAEIKVLLENDQVRVYEATLIPGAVSPSHKRVHRVLHYLTAGKLHRDYSDGSSDDRVFKAGDTGWAEPGTYAVTNNGETTVKLLAVELKH